MNIFALFLTAGWFASCTSGFVMRHADQPGSYPQQLGRPCTEENIIIRKSWTSLMDSEKRDYLDAVQCIRNIPAKTPRSLASGARHRMDDFTVTHINETLGIHFSGWLLPWHRYFIWLFEAELREKCGYRGSQPYWDWTDPQEANLVESSLFDGSSLSLGNNGQRQDHPLLNGSVPGVPDPQVVTRPPGTGGGCVTDGPFANTTLHMGPIFPLPVGQKTPDDYFAYRPHCLTRDFLQAVPDQFLAKDKIEALMKAATLAEFRELADASVHFAGHSGIGGDMSDVFSSSQEPAFYFHHAQLDRLWTQWQLADPQSRTNQTSDTITYANSPPSRNATLFDTLSFGNLGKNVELWEVLDTRGQLCYRYE